MRNSLIKSNFSIQSFRYYWKNKKKFSKKSLANLLKDKKEIICVKNTYSAIKIILDDLIIVKRKGKEVKVTPEMKLRENDIVIVPIRPGCVLFVMRRGKLEILEK